MAVSCDSPEEKMKKHLEKWEKYFTKGKIALKYKIKKCDYYE
jgi:hypothetical protein